MTLDELRSTLSDPSPPAGLPDAVRALWHDARGDWDTAHAIAQDVPGEAGAWVHAYLHRKEGDLANAGYWYRRAGKPESRGPFDGEWAEIAESLLA